jgi:large subunit ribosomal protein L30
MSEPTVRVTQTRSTIRGRKKNELTLRALGLGRIGRTVEHKYTASTAGMLKEVSHLITVEKL